ncbi:hypothetical protein TSOC_013725 [Tetrabaena socialis]|uniref:Methyltransferase domain-containing protein n=1 Tax=Tetrabaena socialis TaxID=47790 RepID=A0A2J7ZJK2_9CHLO|nr:hypothetical protein TSOC_013725 [Tetrabaena socialis]|eukprot:PNH00451.1 hypothetical protein TSOC_013725 [Tetrabaena socialis]
MIWSWSPTSDRLRLDLTRLARVVPRLQEFYRKDFTAPDVTTYFAKTTFRDYRALELVTGSAAMHTPMDHDQLLYVIAQMGEAVNGGRVLEIGFGKGANIVYLADLFPRTGFVGIDLLDEHVAHANSNLRNLRNLRNVDFRKDDASSPVTAHASYDVIFGIESCCYLDTVEKQTGFLRFVKRSLTPTGRLVIVDGYRSADFMEKPPDVQRAMLLAESGFRIREMPSKQTWRRLAARERLVLVDDVDLTAKALPFWIRIWKVAHALLRVPWALRAYFTRHEETGANFVSLAMTAYALAMGSAEYGVLVFTQGP